MLIEERRRRLLEAISQRGNLSVSEAERTLQVSRMTIHRDLDALEAQGLVRKVHGGAVAVATATGALFDPRARPFEERLSEAREAKVAIARHVAKLIGQANTLVLDASSTVCFLADALLARPDAKDLFVVTGGLPVFSALARRAGGPRVALHGGEPHQRTGSLVGPLALASLAETRFDFAVISAMGALTEDDSVFVSNPEEVEVKRAYTARARRTVLAMDSSKFGRSGAYRLGRLSEFDHVVTEKGPLSARDLHLPAGRRARR